MELSGQDPTITPLPEELVDTIRTTMEIVAKASDTRDAQQWIVLLNEGLVGQQVFVESDEIEWSSSCTNESCGTEYVM